MGHFHYIIVRRDLPFGVALAQTAHAAAESARMVPAQMERDTVGVLGVKNEAVLMKLHKRLIRKGVNHVAIYEPDPPWDSALMSIGVAPGVKRWLEPFFRKIQLYRGPDADTN